MLCDLCGRVTVFGNVCALCGLKAPVERLQRAAALNLQTNSVAELVGRFVIENHQAKHYAGGNRDYAHFDSANDALDWRAVHRVITWCTDRILTAQRERGLFKPVDGYVEFTDLRDNQHWYAGRARGFSNVVMVQLTMSVQDGFSGHGYPLDRHRVEALPKGAWLTTTTFAEAEAVQLSSANNSIRILRHGT